MKILTVPLIREADAYTIKHEPVADIDLMERAARACFHWIKENFTTNITVFVFCGAGNNGGDGLAVARMLHGAGYNITTCTFAPPEKMSESCRINYRRMKESGNMKMPESGNKDELPEILPGDVVIDALFGSGLTRPVEGFMADVIHHINSSGATVVAIDVPSGLFCDDHTPAGKGQEVVRADYTLSFAPPKLAFFFPENHSFTGEWHLLGIGIMPEFINNAAVSNFMVGREDLFPLLRRRSKFAHKGHFGHVLLICGSAGKMGAAVLAARACLRSGPGLVTVRIPGSGVPILQTAVPEAMLEIDENQNYLSTITDPAPYASIAAGPGLGTSEATASAIRLLIQETRIPLIFDADAINILAENKTWLGFLPAGCIFTPHPKEFERLAGKSSDDFARNRLQRDFSIRHRCYVVLKGAHTAITSPDGMCYFNTTGNPGMATGGSGDVLTGIIAGLAAQGYSGLESCLIGVYLHGMAGDIAAEDFGQEAMVAGDLIDNLGKSFLTLYGKL